VHNVFVIATAAVTAGYGAVGYLDDRLKIEGANTRGLPGRYKLVCQIIIGALALGYLFLNEEALPEHWLEIRSRLAFPFLAFEKHPVELPLYVYVVFALFVVVATSNAVNLTDGLDGLAISVTMVTAAALTGFTYVTGHAVFANYLGLEYNNEVAELTIFCGALTGASLGFLWFNSPPAEVFMGDVGALGIGGAIGVIAVMIKQEFALVIIGGVFVLEALSVIIQVASFKLFRRRVFKMAPLHHHFELQYATEVSRRMEPKIVFRFLIIAILFALLSLTMLKLR
jgi:phospho-N-acetylmuramoyl-pentapeptide-transferase